MTTHESTAGDNLPQTSPTTDIEPVPAANDTDAHGSAGTLTADAPAPAPHSSVIDTPGYGYAPAPAPGYAPAGMAPGYAQPGRAPIGRIRGTGACIALTVITLGFYSIFWFYKTHQEMKNHSGAGIGGGLAAVLAIFIGIVMPFLTSSEIGNLYRRAGMAQPVSGATGLWYFPGAFIVIGPLIWFIKTNAAINSYWRSHGAA